MKIKGNCVFCKHIWEVTVKAEDADRYLDESELVIQNAFPYLTATERECLISSMCPTCQDKIFG